MAFCCIYVSCFHCPFLLKDIRLVLFPRFCEYSVIESCWASYPWIKMSSTLGICQQMILLGQRTDLFLILGVFSTLIFTVAATIFVATNSDEGSSFPIALPEIVSCLVDIGQFG